MKRWKIMHRAEDGTILDTGLRYFFKFNADEVCKHLNILDLLATPATDVFTQAFRPYKKPYGVVSTKTPSWTEFGPPNDEKPEPVEAA